MENQTVAYNPADDENQGVVTTMVRNEGPGESQDDSLSPSAMLPGPDPDLTEQLNDDDADEADATNEDLLDEEGVGEHDIDVEGDETVLD